MALGPYMGSTGHVRAERLRSDAKYCQWPIPRPDQTYLEQRHAAPSRGGHGIWAADASGSSHCLEVRAPGPGCRVVERGPWSRYLISAAMPGSLRWFPSSPPSAGRAMIQDAALH